MSGPYRFDIHHRLDSDPARSFSVLSFNILCQSCADEHVHDRFAHVREPIYLQWQHRFRRLKEILQNLKPSIICLQEVDLADESITDINTLFSKDDYEVVAQRPKKSSHSHPPRFINVILFRASEFQLEWQQSRSRALLVALKWLPSSTTIYIGNLHLQAKPDDEQIRLQQVGSALHRLEAHMIEAGSNPTDSSLIICGDLNDGIGSNLINLISARNPDAHPFMLDDVDKWMNQLGTGSTTPTYFTPGYHHKLDFIFYSVSSLRPNAALSPVSDDELQQLIRDPPPNAFWPSDHLPVCSTFSIHNNILNTKF